MNHMTSQEVLTHLRYTGWASRKLLEAVKSLGADQISKDVSVSHGSILGTLAHTYFGDAVWYSRVVDPQAPVPNPKEIPSLEGLDVRWREVLGKWEAWAETLSDVDLEKMVSFTRMNGETAQSSVKHLVLHLVNHGTLHRGQVVGMLRQAGVKPPATDFLSYILDPAVKA